MGRSFLLLFVVVPVFLGGCINSPTSTAQITGSYVAPEQYENYSCKQLTTMFNSLTRREDKLIIAQEQRIKSSRVQFIMLGVGTGDGVEASELANVRGQKEAVMEAMALKGCGMTE